MAYNPDYGKIKPEDIPSQDILNRKATTTGAPPAVSSTTYWASAGSGQIKKFVDYSSLKPAESTASTSGSGSGAGTESSGGLSTIQVGVQLFTLKMLFINIYRNDNELCIVGLVWGF